MLLQLQLLLVIIFFACDYSDFEAAPSTAPSNAPAKQDKWASMGSLVNLGTSFHATDDVKKVAAAEPVVAKRASLSTDNSSFAGLDGFSKQQQPMVSVAYSIIHAPLCIM